MQKIVSADCTGTIKVERKERIECSGKVGKRLHGEFRTKSALNFSQGLASGKEKAFLAQGTEYMNTYRCIRAWTSEENSSIGVENVREIQLDGWTGARTWRSLKQAEGDLEKHQESLSLVKQDVFCVPRQ